MATRSENCVAYPRSRCSPLSIRCHLQGINFSQGIVRSPNLGFKKDAAYDFRKNPKHNWRKFMLTLVAVVERTEVHSAAFGSAGGQQKGGQTGE
ncbi:MAG: hypothetical protein DSY70_03030 [Desulfobulbus sp.]|nr:MAG: hypothetical protein DSY70_03030 [Desulfobulbus sp.]